MSSKRLFEPNVQHPSVWYRFESFNQIVNSHGIFKLLILIVYSNLDPICFERLLEQKMENWKIPFKMHNNCL